MHRGRYRGDPVARELRHADHHRDRDRVGPDGLLRDHRGHATAVNALEATIKSAGLTIASGSSPTGAHVCGFNRSKNGHTYQVDVYGGAPTTTCNAAGQTEFLAQAP